MFLLIATPRGFHGVRLFEGLVMVGVYSAAPALIMATTSTERRGRAMALWSTYTPVGVSRPRLPVEIDEAPISAPSR